MDSLHEVDPKNVFAPITVGVVVSAILLGCAVVQANSYYKTFPEDNWFLKMLVATEVLLQSTCTSLLTIETWQVTVAAYERSSPFAIRTSLATMIILSASTAFLVQPTFSVLLYRLFQWPIVFIIHLSLTALRFVLHITIGVASYGMRDIGGLVQQWYWCITAILILSITCDAFVTASLTHQLKMQKTFTQSTQAIDHIIAFTFATGFMTSAVELTAAICFWTHPGNYIWVPLLIAVSGLYTASFLAMLNQRRHFRHMLPDHDFRALAELKAMPSITVVRSVSHSFEQS